ncbi:MAG TPA: hypothetical protein VGA36_11855 [Nitriliruptorales bacterium]
MPNYLYSYHGGGGMPDDPEVVEKVMGLWMAWYDRMGDAVVDAGSPVAMARTVDPDGSVSDGGGANPVNGYTVISADDLDAAVIAAQDHPHLRDGSIEISELIDMSPPEG